MLSNFEYVTYKLKLICHIVFGISFNQMVGSVSGENGF